MKHSRILQGAIATTVAGLLGWGVTKLLSFTGGNELEEVSPDEEEITNQAPTAMINSTDSAEVGEKITLDGSGSTDDSMIVTYNWGLGDGTNATGQTVSHKYSEPGKYTVTLVVTDDQGKEDTVTTEIEIVQSKATGNNTPGFGIITFMLVITLFAAITIYKRKH